MPWVLSYHACLINKLKATFLFFFHLCFLSSVSLFIHLRTTACTLSPDVGAWKSLVRDSHTEMVEGQGLRGETRTRCREERPRESHRGEETGNRANFPFSPPIIRKELEFSHHPDGCQQSLGFISETLRLRLDLLLYSCVTAKVGPVKFSVFICKPGISYLFLLPSFLHFFL